MFVRLIKKFLRIFKLEIRRVLIKNPISFKNLPKDKSQFDKWHKLCDGQSLNVSRDRFLSLFQSMKYIYDNNIKGDFVECGVFMGGSSMMMAFCMKNFKSKTYKRKLWMYDTFEGMTRPNKDDVNILNENALKLLNTKKKIENEKDIWAYSSLATVIRNLKKTNLNKSQYTFIKGPVEKTLKNKKPNKIALLRLDTDFYSSTKSELEFLYSRVEKNGIVLIDDYGHWKGCKKAVDSFFKNKKNIFVHPVDYSGLIILKIR